MGQMPKTKFPEAASAYRGDAAEEHTVHFTASSHWYSPVPNRPWSSKVHPVTCIHHHKTREGAVKCGERKAARAVAAYQAAVNAEYPARPCDIKVAADPGVYSEEGVTGHLVYCAAHLTTASTWWRTEDEASADPWVCPWAALVKVGA